MPARRQTIIWTNDGQFTDAYMRHSASNDNLKWVWESSDQFWSKRKIYKKKISLNKYGDKSDQIIPLFQQS